MGIFSNFLETYIILAPTFVKKSAHNGCDGNDISASYNDFNWLKFVFKILTEEMSKKTLRPIFIDFFL